MAASSAMMRGLGNRGSDVILTRGRNPLFIVQGMRDAEGKSLLIDAKSII
jgi:hypothetical protein